MATIRAIPQFSLKLLIMAVAATAALLALFKQISRPPILPYDPAPVGRDPTRALMMVGAVTAVSFWFHRLRGEGTASLFARIGATSCLILSFFSLGDFSIWLAVCFGATAVAPLFARGFVLDEWRPGTRKERALGVLDYLVTLAVCVVASLMVFSVVCAAQMLWTLR